MDVAADQLNPAIGEDEREAVPVMGDFGKFPAKAGFYRDRSRLFIQPCAEDVVQGRGRI